MRLYFAALLLMMVFTGGCTPSLQVKDYSSLNAKSERDVVYVVPFDATLVPPDFGEPIFNQFVDMLNLRRGQTKVGRFLILKEELKDVDPSWLIRQVYISGDIWGFVENSGCCSTEMKVKSRVYLYEPGKNTPTFEVFDPAEYYVDHNRSDQATAKAMLGQALAKELAEAVIKKLTP